jgi:protein TonB
MTALARPGSGVHDPLAPLRRRNSERGMFSIALFSALALHLVVLMLPLPSRPAPPPEEPPSLPDRMIDWSAPIPPPELPEPALPAAAPPERILPVPMPDIRPQEPVEEPLSTPLPPPLAVSLPEVGNPDPPLPENYGVVPEGTAGLVLPRLISKCSEPAYPAMAIRARREGVVVLRALITEEGDVGSIEIFQAPHPDLGFSESAIAAISCWKYEPGLYRGLKVAVSLTVIVEFELD